MSKFLWLIGVAANVLSAGQLGSVAPVPANPWEPAASGVRTVTSHEERAQLIQLLDRARGFYSLNTAGVPYHLKTSFTVSSNGTTQFDGDWQMDMTHAPGLGTLITAETANYSVRHLRAGNIVYQSPQGSMPLRLHEAIGHLLGSMESTSWTERDLIRTVQADVSGMSATCILLAGAHQTREAGAPGRLWEEREECIDPQTGHLILHSPSPGLTILYDFAGSRHFHGKELPRKMTVMENGAIVMTEQVETLEDLPTLDASLFTPTAAMQPGGTVMGSRFTMPLWIGRPTVPANQAVMVFGLLNPDGSISEAHALEASDPRLVEAAVNLVSQLKLHIPVAPGANVEQREFFGFVRSRPTN